jgi:hypothetical protein
LQRYQLQPAFATKQCHKGIMGAHNPKLKRRRRKIKNNSFATLILFFVAALQPTPKI